MFSSGSESLQFTEETSESESSCTGSKFGTDSLRRLREYSSAATESASFGGGDDLPPGVGRHGLQYKGFRG